MQITCITCGTPFQVKPSEYKRGRRRCKRACYIRVSKLAHLPTETQFWMLVSKTDSCWLWTGWKSPDGYGRFKVGAKWWAAHRFSWQLTFGEIQKGLLVCHHCDVPACVRPDHLFLGTNQDNMKDASAKLRINGDNNSNAKLTTTQVLQIRQLGLRNDLSYVSIARRFGITPNMARYIIKGHSWKHLLPKTEQLSML